MTTLVPGPLRRSVSGDSFADIAPGVDFMPADDGLLFAANLSPAQVAAVAARMASKDDDDQAARANLHALCVTASAPGATAADVAALSCAVANYLLNS